MRIGMKKTGSLILLLALVTTIAPLYGMPLGAASALGQITAEDSSGSDQTLPAGDSSTIPAAGLTLGDPFTIDARLVLPEPSGRSVIPLVGLATQADGIPSALALEWTTDPRSWFPVWTVQLTSQLGLLPEGLVDARTNTGASIHLLRAAPQSGHEYRASLSYDPENQHLSFLLEDVTEGKTLTAGSLPLKGYGGTMYPSVYAAGIDVSEADLKAAVEVSRRPAWYGLPLAIQRDFTAQLLAQAPDDGRLVRKVGVEYLEGEPVILRLDWPAEPVPGVVLVKSVQGTEERLLHVSRWSEDLQDVLHVSSPLPLGDSALVLEYVDGPRRAVVQRYDLRVIKAKVNVSYILHGRDYDRGTLVGQVTITPQTGSVEDTELRIMGTYRPSGLTAADDAPIAHELLRARLSDRLGSVSFPFELPAPWTAGQLELTAFIDHEHIVVSGGDRRIAVAGVPAMPEDPSLFPFVVNPWHESPDNITNVSVYLEKPAGKHGFITVQDGRFVTGDGRPIRFLGVNCSFSGCFPDHASAEKIARQLARFGINLVRFHHMDNQAAPSGIWRAGVFPREFDLDQLDRLDYFIYQLKLNGIYSNLNLHVSRTMQPQEGFPDPQRRPTYDKGLNMYHPDIIAHQKEYARQLLTHRNPYTGNRYIEEPAIAMIEITNEGGLINFIQRGAIDAMPEMYKGPLDDLWNDWLAERYETTDNLAAAWGRTDAGLLPGESLETKVSRPSWDSLSRRSAQVRRDYIDFLWDVEQAYFREMYRYIRDELGAQAPISGTQVRWSPQGIQAELDYIDVHSYWRHPEFPGASWDTWNWFVRNDSMAATTNGGNIPYVASTRVAGKPFVISEYNHPAPNTYGSEGFLLAGAYGAFQDWDGIVAFAWTRDDDFWTQKITSFFDIKSHPAKLVTLPAVWALFVRGDVEPAKETVVASLPDELQRQLLTEKPVSQVAAGDAGVQSRIALQHGLAVSVGAGSEHAPASPDTVPNLQQGPVITTDTGELHWDLSGSGRGALWVDTLRSKAVIGHGAGRIFDLSGVTIAPGQTRQDGWSAITLTVMEGESFAGPSRILLTATGYAANPGMVWEDLGDGRVTVRTHWGDEPSIVEGIPARIVLPVPAEKVQVYALDGAGERRAPVPVSADGSNEERAVFHIGPEYRTLWYEVEVE